MTLFDPDPLTIKVTEAAPETVAEIHPLSCRQTGCTRPIEAHVVTQAAIWNAAHPVPTTRKKRKAT